MRIGIVALIIAALIQLSGYLPDNTAVETEEPDGMIDTMNIDNEIEAQKPRAVLLIKVNGNTLYASLEDNSSAAAFVEKLSREGEIEVDMHDYGGFEKVGSLPWELPRNDESITTKPGDVILYQGDQITIYYDRNTWSFTKLAEIGNTDREKLYEALGSGDAKVSFSLEWSE